ncbi:hypothetical protein BDZ91DRAFT_743189, partial [Kalaharituber pfeilii]
MHLSSASTGLCMSSTAVLSPCCHERSLNFDRNSATRLIGSCSKEERKAGKAKYQLRTLGILLARTRILLSLYLTPIVRARARSII